MTGGRLTVWLALAIAGAGQSVRECATCHPVQATPQPHSAMAQALQPAGKSAILREHPLLTFRSGGFDYRIESNGAESVYTVTDGQQTIRAPLLWAFGKGSLGQTYVYEWNGKLYQSRVSFYQSLDGLDFTIGARNQKPAGIETGAGLSMEGEEGVQCFGCHSTHAVTGHELTLASMTPGVQCERCHGPSEKHVAGMRTGGTAAAAARMPSLRGLNAEGQLNFCGGCHRTWEQIATTPGLGVLNVRFQPYRLTNSKCYDVDDRRIACTACHDPHAPLSHEAAAYDARCQSCHAGGKAGARRCKAAQATGCSGCHMPKVEVRDAHHRFTDHEIRIVRANAPYPE